MAEQQAVDAEELQLQVEGEICKLPVTELEQLAKHVGLTLEAITDKTRLTLSRTVRSKIDSELENAEDPITYLQGIHNFIADTPPPLEESLHESHDIEQNDDMQSEKTETDHGALQNKFEEMKQQMKEAVEQLEAMKPSASAAATSKPSESTTVRSLI